MVELFCSLKSLIGKIYLYYSSRGEKAELKRSTTTSKIPSVVENLNVKRRERVTPTFAIEFVASGYRYIIMYQTNLLKKCRIELHYHG